MGWPWSSPAGVVSATSHSRYRLFQESTISVQGVAKNRAGAAAGGSDPAVLHRSRRIVDLGCERSVLCRDSPRDDRARRSGEPHIQLPPAVEQTRTELLDRCGLLQG